MVGDNDSSLAPGYVVVTVSLTAYPNKCDFLRKLERIVAQDRLKQQKQFFVDIYIDHCYVHFPFNYGHLRKSLKNKNAIVQGQVGRKPINANSGLRVNRRNNFSCIKMSFTANVLCIF